jgi:hypothetical protein
MDAHGDPHYQYISKKKDDLIHTKDVWDADELSANNKSTETTDPDDARWEEQVKTAIRLYRPWDDSRDHTYKEVAKVVGRSDTWVGNRIQEWRDDEHRDLVSNPTEK